MTGRSRLWFLDNLRWILVILVIAHHAGQAYGPTGGKWPVTDGSQVGWLGYFFTVNASFLMGILFFISGYVLPGAYDRYGSRGFFISKVKRLFIPYAFVVLFIFLPINYIFGSYQSLADYLRFCITPDGVNAWTGHLWYVTHLFIYSVVNLLYRVIAGRFTTTRSEERAGAVSSIRVAAALIGIIALVSCALFFVRTQYVIDRWVVLFNVVRAEPAHVPQYLVFFIVGVFAGTTNLIERLRSRDGMIALAAGLFIAISGAFLVKTGSSWFGTMLSAQGSSVDSLLRAFWETTLAVMLSLGLVVLARDRMNNSARTWRFLSDNSYGTYLYHVFPMVGIQMFLVNVRIGAGLKFIIVTILTTVICYITIALVRKIGIMRKYI
jgi:peptidoglycan/LPS O-acetylase OafA/YrhL